MPTNTRPTNGETEVILPADAAIAADNRNPRRPRRRAQNPAPVRADDPDGDDGQVEAEPTMGTLEQTGPQDTLEALVLFPECRAAVLDGLRQINMRDQLESVWGISSILPMSGRCVLNFWGKPGTGKTRVARAIAAKLGKPLLRVDYSEIISKYLGDTAKHIKKAFAEAREFNAVLLFDEADSLCSRRINMAESCATSINQNRNVLMQELDGFDGVVVLTTNLFENFEPALLRRIAKHVEFKLPNRSMRREIFRHHACGQAERWQVDWDEVAGQSKWLSGGDILNVCVNSILSGSRSEDPAEWAVTTEIVLREVYAVKEAKEANGGTAEQ